MKPEYIFPPALLLILAGLFLWPRIAWERTVVRVNCEYIAYIQNKVEDERGVTWEPSGRALCVTHKANGELSEAQYGCGLLVEEDPSNRWDIILCHKEKNMLTILLNGYKTIPPEIYQQLIWPERL